MAQIPTIGRIVHFHHAGEGLADGNPRDYPAVILEVSGGPIDNDSAAAGQQTDRTETDLPYVCLLQVLRPRGTEWLRCAEGVGSGQWSWPPITGSSETSLLERVHALEERVRGYVDKYLDELSLMAGEQPS